jgi:KDO2-lipid IV(A) lauroyltransferase
VKLSYRLEYAALRLVVAFLEALPLAWALALMRGLADVFYRLDRRRGAIARDNVLLGGLADDARGADRIARDSYRHLAMLLIESLRSERLLSPPSGESHVNIVAPDSVRALLEDPAAGLMLCSGHFGNWELAGQWLSRFKPVAGITQRMKNPLVEAWIQQRKPRERFRLIPKLDADMARFVRVLDAGEILALLVDQHGGARGEMIEFLGRPAPTHMSPALLHLVTGTPLVFCTCRRTAPLQFEIEFSEPLQFERSGRR